LAIFRIIASLIVAILPLTGCAFTTGHVDLSYQPMTKVTKVAQPDSPSVNVEVSDKRPNPVVGEKINGFGMKTADIVSNNDIPALLKSAFETELNSRGFTAGRNGNTVHVQLDNFQNQFTLGFASGDATASIGMDVSIVRADGAVPYKQYITAQTKDWIEVAGEDNAQRMLDAALHDAVAKVFNDNAFIDALEKR